ncbi:hypothetical protein [Bradyrhizobium sp. USDA 3364]
MMSVLAAFGADSACFPAAPIGSPEVADIVVVLRLRNFNGVCLYKRAKAHSNGCTLQSM